MSGRVEEISSSANPRIKAIKALAQKKFRDRDGLFLAEGAKLARDALDAGWRIATLVHSRSAPEDVETLAATVHARGGDVLIVPDKLLTAITRRDNPAAVVAVIEQQQQTVSEPKRDDETWLALDRVRDPGNLGTCFRTAEALGVSRIVLVGETTDPFALETVRATMGAFFHVPFSRMGEADFIAFCRRWPGQVTGTHLAGAVDHRTIDFSGAAQMIVMGNEQAGLTDALAAACSQLAKIPMSGRADSLNLAVATGIVVFEARRHLL